MFKNTYWTTWNSQCGGRVWHPFSHLSARLKHKLLLSHITPSPPLRQFLEEARYHFRTIFKSMTLAYWAIGTRGAQARDLGHRCKQCTLPFSKVGETIVLRRGGRIELRYHEACFSGEADPRTQTGSSFHTSNHSVPPAAPVGQYRKMRTASQF